ncbi:LysR family transcriptional regulator [Rhizobium sp. S152]|nr:LysR family transcriptional regulator [Rhizobium sp. S152]MDM9628516.1 LysR family transcriptional regulator [Rhizobium sp. S152]
MRPSSLSYKASRPLAPMIENLSALQVFVRVAKTQSFSQAARE